jgi:ATP-dependent RNA helicase DeaD
MDAGAQQRALGPELSAALVRKGYAQLTTVQEAVLDPALAGRDLRITSQTGSGKTLAIGFALRADIEAPPPAPPAHGVAAPRALVVAPTRELARQTQAELQWLYADLKAHVVAITGGSSYRDERRELARGPRVVVGTPGRLLDHLRRGAIDPAALAAVVLDEADRLLDMGFREDLDAILALVPPAHRTHLVSATFPRAVRALADRVQREAAHVEGTRLGAANADIEHVVHVIDPRQKLDAIVNLLLADPEAQTLVFARTRADVGMLAQELVRAGFSATALSGELDQAARNRALSAFKLGRESVLVATDVAARGIDVQDVTRVIHAEPPTSADAYTHRAGRTGRAGRKGTSCLLVSLAQVVPATRLLRAAGIPHRFEPIPSAESIRRAADARVLEELTSEAESAAEVDPRALELARKLLATGQSERIVARLLVRARSAGAEPREVRELAHPTTRDRPRRGERERAPYPKRGERERAPYPQRDPRRRDADPRRNASPPRADREAARAEQPAPRGEREAQRAGQPAPRRERAASRAEQPSLRHDQPPPRDPEASRRERATRPAQDRSTGASPGEAGDAFVPFRVSWGGLQGADARRLLAIVCRRGRIRGTDVGAIRIEADHSIVEVARSVSDAFATQAARPDRRDRNVQIRPLAPQSGRAPLRRR